MVIRITGNAVEGTEVPAGKVEGVCEGNALRVQTPPKKVFWGGFGGLNPFSGGTWTLRDGSTP